MSTRCAENGWASNVAVASAGEIQKSPDEVPLWHQPVVLWQKKVERVVLPRAEAMDGSREIRLS